MQDYIRGGVLEHFPETVEALGGDTMALLRAAEVAPEILTIPGIYLPYPSYMRLLHLAARETGTPHFGLLMSRSANAETLGTTGIIMTQAQTLGDAWKTLVHFYRIHDTYGTAGFRLDQGSATVRYALPRNDRPGTRQVYDVAAGIVDNIMRRFCGRTFRAQVLSFPYTRPEDTAPYRGLAAGQLEFGSAALEIQFDRSLWSQALPEQRLAATATLGPAQLRGAAAQQSSSQLVEDTVRRWLASGDCTLPFVARALAMTPRTLQMHLAREGCSFRQITEKVRREIATYHLRQADMSLTQLAMVLGYSELSAFSRSFRSWFGVSPQRWQAQSANS